MRFLNIHFLRMGNKRFGMNIKRNHHAAKFSYQIYVRGWGHFHVALVGIRGSLLLEKLAGERYDWVRLNAAGMETIVTL